MGKRVRHHTALTLLLQAIVANDRRSITTLLQYRPVPASSDASALLAQTPARQSASAPGAPANRRRPPSAGLAGGRPEAADTRARFAHRVSDFVSDHIGLGEIARRPQSAGTSPGDVQINLLLVSKKGASSGSCRFSAPISWLLNNTKVGSLYCRSACWMPHQVSSVWPTERTNSAPHHWPVAPSS